MLHGVTADDLDPEAQIGRHASNHGELLEILRSEHGDMGSGRKEEFRDDRGHTAKMTRPIRSTQWLRQAIDIDARSEDGNIETLTLGGYLSSVSQWQRLCERHGLDDQAGQCQELARSAFTEAATDWKATVEEREELIVRLIASRTFSEQAIYGTAAEDQDER